MKTFLAKPLLLIFASLFVFACDKDDSPQLQASQLEEIIAGHYWNEKIHFMVYGSLDQWPKTIHEHSEDIIEFFRSDGSNPYPDQTTLDQIYVEKDTRKVWRYMKDKYGGYVTHYQNSYKITYDDVNRSIRICSPFDSLTYMNAVTESEMRIVSMDENEIVFDAPIKPFIREHWHLDVLSESHYEDYLGIRIHWTKMNPSAFQSSKPLD